MSNRGRQLRDSCKLWAAILVAVSIAWAVVYAGVFCGNHPWKAGADLVDP